MLTKKATTGAAEQRASSATGTSATGTSPAGKSKAKTKAAAKPAVKAEEKPIKAAEAQAATVPAGNGAQAAGAKKKKTEKREKVIRDSFTMPKHDFEKIAELKATCLKNGVVVKKSELLRAGLAALAALPEKKLLAVVASIETVKTGRPATH
ncbi:hypothetical protein FAZ69_03055 [Trinickia terrae]|uniref:Uncharacterized protein n=1 Tax=Trinickia terrae TaxID=2571161 RepID=A0A4U1IG45_9BURK|nr:hypothetical protein [Trinickia terrae]TKC92661.1 hypothetical protein FAZ69_03055 [Trinickia terrae]